MERDAEDALEVFLLGKDIRDLHLHLILAENILDPLKGLRHGEKRPIMMGI